MIDLSNESGEEVDTQALIRLARFALDKLRIHPQADLSILLVDVDTMTAYHKQFMNLDGPTDAPAQSEPCSARQSAMIRSFSPNITAFSSGSA